MESEGRPAMEEGLFNTPIDKLKQSFISKYLRFTETKVAGLLKHLQSDNIY
jgi:hypothetical protein